MIKKQERTAFNFYKSYFTCLDLLDDSEKLEFLMGLFNKQFYGIEPELSKIPQMVYMTQKHSVDKQVEGWESKTKSKLTPPLDPTEGGSVGPTQGGYEGKMKNLVLASAMTTEGPTEDPYQQEQGQEQEKEEGQEQELVLELETDKYIKRKNIR